MNWRKGKTDSQKGAASEWEAYKPNKSEEDGAQQTYPSPTTATDDYPEATELKPGDLFRSRAEIYKGKKPAKNPNVKAEKRPGCYWDCQQ